MLALRELQTSFRRALLKEDGLASHTLDIADGDLAAGERLAVYRNKSISPTWLVSNG